MPEAAREAWITGIGIVSCLGEGVDAHWRALNAGEPRPNLTSFAPRIVHSIAPLEFDKQIPKKGDQRQMELWQRIGVYSAGLALDAAGLKGNTELLSRTDMIVCAGGGERDLAVDAAIMGGLHKAQNPDTYLNERLMSDLRPTLFLAQLSNLLAGNISIVHGVTGSSRTFMGEEAAGVDAVRISLSRILAGQSDIALVGGSYNADRPDLLMLHEAAGYLLKDKFAPIWERAPKGGGAHGSIGAFLVIEERGHANRRSAKRLARLRTVVADRSRRAPGDVTKTLARLWEPIAAMVKPGHVAILSGATGVEPATSEERDFLTSHPDIAVRATGTYLGHGIEPQFPMNVALAAITVGHGKLFPAHDASGVERPMNGALEQVVVTGVGHWRGEGLALVEAPSLAN